MSGGASLDLTHFQAFLLFAVVISIAFGFLGRRRPKDRVKYILWSLFLWGFFSMGSTQTELVRP